MVIRVKIILHGVFFSLGDHDLAASVDIQALASGLGIEAHAVKGVPSLTPGPSRAGEGSSYSSGFIAEVQYEAADG